MRLKLELPWSQVKEMLKENDITLTDEDLAYTPGKEDELIERLSGRMGKSHEEVRAYIESLSANTGLAG